MKNILRRWLGSGTNTPDANPKPQEFETVSDVIDFANTERSISTLGDLQELELRLGIPGALTRYLSVPDTVAEFTSSRVKITILTTGHNIVLTKDGSPMALDQEAIDHLRTNPSPTT